MNRVFVVGSLNRDLVLSVERCPLPGQTVLAEAMSAGCGGKGANQAVAAARAGASVVMVGCVGTDPEAEFLLDALRSAGVDPLGVASVAGPSGLAVVTVAADGENEIVVAPGANSLVDATVVRVGLAALASGDVVLAQAEIPPEAIRAAADLAEAKGARFVLNLAPPIPIDLAQLKPAVLLVNEHEAAAVWGEPIDDPTSLAEGLADRHNAVIVVTLGGDGAVLAADGSSVRIAAYQPDRVVDTTGAGDAFAGAFAAALALGLNL